MHQQQQKCQQHRDFCNSRNSSNIRNFSNSRNAINCRYSNRRDATILWMEASKPRDVNNSNYAKKVQATTAIATTIHARKL